jgi:nitrogen fixation-related uncharacterized protein
MNNEKLDSETVNAALINEELFQPSLTEDDDVAGFNQPWNPWTLVVLTFFFGIVPGVGLLAFNYERLGIKGRLYGTLAVAVVIEVLATLIYVWAVQSGTVDPANRDDWRPFRFAIKAGFVLTAILVARTQQKRFRLFERSGLPAGHLLKPALAAIAVGLCLDLLEGALILPAILNR